MCFLSNKIPPDLLAGGKGARCPIPKTSPPTLGPAGLTIWANP